MSEGLILFLISAGVFLLGWLLATLLSRLVQAFFALVGVDASYARLQKLGLARSPRQRRDGGVGMHRLSRAIESLESEQMDVELWLRVRTRCVGARGRDQRGDK